MPNAALSADETGFTALVRAICHADTAAVRRLLRASPALVSGRARQDLLIREIAHYVYRGDTALHVAAAAYRGEIVRELLSAGADTGTENRRGAQPLHYACDGIPGSPIWNPSAQADVIATLIDAGADPNATDKSGVAPLHRAVRTRCAAAVATLIAHGADALLRNRSGSTPLDLAVRNTGRGGSGSPEAKAQQAEIVHLLELQQ